MIKNTKISSRHWSLKEKARTLRKKGLGYNEILKHIPVAKSTISLWVRDIRLTEDQRRKLYDRQDSSMKGIKTIQNFFWRLRCESFEQGITLHHTYKDQPDFIGGLMLYWAEGNKQRRFGFTNSDSAMIALMVRWLEKYLEIPSKNLYISCNIHSGQNEQMIIKFWKNVTSIPQQNFKKNFIKPEGSGYKRNLLYNGTARIGIIGKGSTYKLFVVLGALAAHIKTSLGKPINIEDWITKLPHAD
jgi:hypothetical protein